MRAVEGDFQIVVLRCRHRRSAQKEQKFPFLLECDLTSQSQLSTICRQLGLIAKDGKVSDWRCG